MKNGTQTVIETDNGFIEGWGGLTAIQPEEKQMIGETDFIGRPIDYTQI